MASAVYQSQGGKVKLEDALLQWGADPPQDDQALSGLEGFLSNLS
ncbi:hypothetical protein [Xenorhabdus bovienii]